MSEESRLGRESIQTGYALKQIMDAGVRVFYYLEDQERTLNSPMDKIMLSLTSFASEMEREKGRQRSHDALTQKAKHGYVTGGLTYGYNNIEVFSPEFAPDGSQKRMHVIRQIKEGEAEVVRRMFRMYSDGLGITKIAKQLNHDHIPAPRKTKGWCPATIREMLHREAYRGKIVWNKYKSEYKGGTTTRSLRPETEWIRVDAPELRIVPPEVIEIVDRRLKKNEEVYIRYKGKLLGRPCYRDFESKYLLTGFAQCTVCEGNLIVQSYPVKGRRTRRYGCGHHQRRGSTICNNNLLVPMEVLDQVLLQAVSEALDERLMEKAIDAALQRLRSGGDERLDRTSKIKRELDLIHAKNEKLLDAIACGDSPELLVERIRQEERRGNELKAELASLQNQGDTVSTLDEARLKRQMRKSGADLQGLLTRNTPQARQILRKLLDGKIRCTPVEHEGGASISNVGAGFVFTAPTPPNGFTIKYGVPNGIQRELEHSNLLCNQ